MSDEHYVPAYVRHDTFEARIEAIEARMDARWADLCGKIAEQNARMEERDARFALYHEEAREAVKEARGLKTTMVILFISTMLTIIGTGIALHFSIQASILSISQTITG